uniref:Uncharacterized protein n=1 Tax=viral metagenome TaxID=1070528 RepID=A0A6C0DMM1_9ZZZZ
MEEFYKLRYNLHKYFLDIDNDVYSRYIYYFTIFIYLLGILLPIFLICLIKNLSVYIFVFLGFILLYYYFAYKLYKYLIDIPNNVNLKSYKSLYEILNIIYRINKETLKNEEKFKAMINNTLKPSIRNIENIYDDKIINDIILKAENDNDILKYFDLDLYLNDDTNYSLILKSGDTIAIKLMQIISNRYYDNKYIYDDAKGNVNGNVFIKVNLKSLFTESKNDEIRTKVLLYINKLYNINLSTLYIEPNLYIYKDLISSLKSNIGYYTIICCYFILVILHGLFINFNIGLTYLYLSIIIIAFIIMSYYN